MVNQKILINILSKLIAILIQKGLSKTIPKITKIINDSNLEEIILELELDKDIQEIISNLIQEEEVKK
jgi:hypothetical protein